MITSSRKDGTRESNPCCSEERVTEPSWWAKPGKKRPVPEGVAWNDELLLLLLLPAVCRTEELRTPEPAVDWNTEPPFRARPDVALD